MASAEREERLRDLGESACLVLKESYKLLQELKGMVDRLHASCLQQGKPTTNFDTIAAIKLTTDRLYGDLERYLRPEVDPDSAHPDAMIDNPKP